MIDNITIKEIMELKNLFGGRSQQEKLETAYEIGRNYLIRTVTMMYVGKLKKIYQNELVLEGAAWIADSGRFSDALEVGLEKSNSSEIEMFIKDTIVGRGGIIDATIYAHDLPTKSK